MKRFLIPAFLGWVTCCLCVAANAQEFTDHIKKEFTLRKSAAGSVLAVYNMSGFIRVESYSGDKVIMEIDEKMSAKTESQLERGKKEFKMVFDQTDDTVLFYILEPYDTRPNIEHKKNTWDDRELRYTTKLDIVLKVPAEMNLDVSTVMDGDVTIKDVFGKLKACNVVGSVKITNAKNTTEARTISGNVTINYLENPKEESSFYALSGSVNVTFRAGLSADMQFKTMNGQFYTDFDDAQVLPTRVIKSKEKEGDGTMYRLGNTRDVRIGSGGKIYKFETLTGSVYIKKQS